MLAPKGATTRRSVYVSLGDLSMPRSKWMEGRAGIWGALLLFFAAGVMAAPLPPIDLEALADEAELLRHDSFVTSATHAPERTLDAISNVFVLTRDEIQALAPRDLGDLLLAIPGLDVFRLTDQRFGAGPAGLAGEFSTQYLVMVDGIHFPSARMMTTDWGALPVPLDQIERIEYVAGPQTDLYGPWAPIGVINVVTRLARPNLWDDGPSSASMQVGGQTFRRSDLNLNLEKNRTAWSVWGRYRGSKGFPTATQLLGVPVPGYPDLDASHDRFGGISMQHQIDAHRSLRLDWSHRQLQAELHQPLDMINVTTPDRDERHVTTSLVYRDQPRPDRDFQLSLRHHREYKAYASPLWYTFDKSETEERYSDTLVEIRHSLGTGRRDRFTSGILYEKLQGEGSDYAAGSHALESLTLTHLYEHRLNVRQRFFLGADLLHSSLTDNDVSAKLGFHHVLGRGEVLRFGYGQSVRGPDLKSSFPYTLDALRLPNGTVFPLSPPIIAPTRELSVETYRLAEVGWERRWRGASAKVDLFHGSVKDRVLFTASGDTLTVPGFGTFPQYTYVNDPAKLALRGAMVTLERAFSPRFHLRLAYRHNRMTYPNFPRRLAPRNLWLLHLTHRPDDRWSVSALGRIVSSYTAFQGSDPFTIGAIDGYGTLDLVIRRLLGRKKDRSWWMRMGNVFDHHHHEVFETIKLPPTAAIETERIVTFGYEMRF